MKLEKITKKKQGDARRTYQDACAAAHALDLVGERWALLVIRELMLGPKRFSDLRAALPGISANVLTQRLEGLEAAGVLVRRELPPPAASRVYELTEWGYEAEPIFQALGRWAVRSPTHDPSLPLSPTSLMLSLRTMIVPERADGLDARIGFRIDGSEFVAQLRDGEMPIVAGRADEADVVFEGSPQGLLAAVYGGEPLAGLEAENALRVTGDRALAERFVTLFDLPPKVDDGS